MIEKKVYIITDCSKEIGLGHIARCLSFYDKLSEKGYEVEMIIDSHDVGSEMYGQRIYQWINWHDDISLLNFVQGNILFLDSLIATQEQSDYLHNLASYFVVIDDFKRRKYKNTLIVDWTPNVEHTDKHAHNMGDGNSLLLGLSYSVLREPFVLPFEYQISELKTLTICMGGSDIRNLTLPILHSLYAFFPAIEINTILGPGIKITPSLIDNRIIYWKSLSAEEMRNVFLKSDLVISAGGQTLFELAALRIPTIPIQVADNQTEDLIGLKSLGFFDEIFQWNESCLYDKIVQKIQQLASVSARIKYIQRFQIPGVGKGLDKIVNHIIKNHASF